MDKTFYITYWASKHKKHITRQGKHDDKSRYGVSKNGTPYYVYYDLEALMGWGIAIANITIILYAYILFTIMGVF
jgi:hypothetical protein